MSAYSGVLLLITTSFPQIGDGSEAAGSFVADLAAALAQEGPVRVVAPGPTTVREVLSESLSVYRYAAPSQPLSTLRLQDPRQWVAILRTLRAGQRAVYGAAADGAVAHALAFWALPSGLWARRLERRSGIPYSVWMLGSDVWTLGRLPVVRSLLRHVMRKASTRFADGLQLAADSRRICGMPVEFLPSTRNIHARRVRPPRGAPPYRLLYLGRWHPNKGIDLLLVALLKLSEEDWRCISAVEICGGGPLESAVFSGVHALRVAGRPIELRGYLDKAAAEAAILRADYLLIPSRIESIPLVFSDAVKLGCPVIATPVGDMNELVQAEPRCGLVAEAVCSSAMAAVIAAAVSQSPSSFSAGLERASKLFDLSLVADRLHRSLDLHRDSIPRG